MRTARVELVEAILIAVMMAGATDPPVWGLGVCYLAKCVAGGLGIVGSVGILGAEYRWGLQLQKPAADFKHGGAGGKGLHRRPQPQWRPGRARGPSTVQIDRSS
eukprot:scaffold8751_cov98-Isochrysis_galbana.AAC.6